MGIKHQEDSWKTQGKRDGEFTLVSSAVTNGNGDGGASSGGARGNSAKNNSKTPDLRDARKQRAIPKRKETKRSGSKAKAQLGARGGGGGGGKTPPRRIAPRDPPIRPAPSSNPRNLAGGGLDLRRRGRWGMGSVDGEVDGIHAGEPAADLDAPGLLNSGLGAQCLGWGEVSRDFG